MYICVFKHAHVRVCVFTYVSLNVFCLCLRMHMAVGHSVVVWLVRGWWRYWRVSVVCVSIDVFGREVRAGGGDSWSIHYSTTCHIFVVRVRVLFRAAHADPERA